MKNKKRTAISAKKTKKPAKIKKVLQTKKTVKQATRPRTLAAHVQPNPAVRSTIGQLKKDELPVVAPEKIVLPENEKPTKTPAFLQGKQTVLAKEEKHWQPVLTTAQYLAEYFQFKKITTPTIEEVSQYARATGKGSDAAEKELYVFENSEGLKIAVRPDSTGGGARAYLAGNLANHVQPVKLWYFESVFRHERPPVVRSKEQYQVSFETLGVKDPAIDAELILIGFNFYKDLGVPVEVRINSLGTAEERARYKEELLNYFRTKRSYLCEDCRQRLNKSPFKLLDCKEEQCQPIKEEAPQIVDWLGAESKLHFVKVLEFLDELGIPYVLSHTLVRGFEYYNDTIFEFFGPLKEGAVPQALGGGGRYDRLLEECGGKPAPAAGVVVGMDPALLVAGDTGRISPAKVGHESKTDIYFAQLGDDAKRRALRIINDLRGSGIRVAFNFFKNSLKSQLEIAQALKVTHVLILGQKEVQDKAVIIRDMESGVQEIVDQRRLEIILKRKLGQEVSPISAEAAE